MVRETFFHPYFRRITGLTGDVVDVGVGGGDSTLLMVECGRDVEHRPVWAYDVFDPRFPVDTAVDGEEEWFLLNNVGGSGEETRQKLEEAGVRCVKGYFPGTFWAERPDSVVLVHLDVDTYVGIRSGLDLFGPLLAPGGFFLVHDWLHPGLPGVKRAVKGFLAANPGYAVDYEKETQYIVLQKGAS